MKALELYRLALHKYGREAQMRQAQEECAELIAALNQFIRGTRGTEHVVTEIADVKIMVEQLELMFGRIAVAKERDRKLERLEDRLNAVVTIYPKPTDPCHCGKNEVHVKTGVCA